MDNDWKKEMMECRDADDKFKQMFLGNWDATPQPLTDERLFELQHVRKAEFVRIEETISMAYELRKARHG